MEQRIQEIGILYEKLMIRAFHLEHPSITMGADRKIYYLLHYIKIGCDLRGTGYPTQFNLIKGYINAALQNLLMQELHREEQANLNKIVGELHETWSEGGLEKVLKKALKATERLDKWIEEMV